MANFTFNVAKGRVIELYHRVDDADPAAAELVILLLANTGLDTQALLEDAATVSELLLLGTTDESTNTGSSVGDRKILVTADLDPISPDNTNNWSEVDILVDPTWTSVANDGNGAIGALVIAYDPLGTGVDTNLIPLTYHDFAVTPDGSDITAQITNFFRAT